MRDELPERTIIVTHSVSALERIAELEQQLAEAVADREVLARFFYLAHDDDVFEVLGLSDEFGDLTELGKRLNELGRAAEQRAAGGAE